MKFLKRVGKKCTCLALASELWLQGTSGTHDPDETESSLLPAFNWGTWKVAGLEDTIYKCAREVSRGLWGQGGGPDPHRAHSGFPEVLLGGHSWYMKPMVLQLCHLMPCPALPQPGLLCA